MWTPRRLVVLLASVAAGVAVYCLYSALLGRIDGLPTIPAAYLVRSTADDITPLPTRNPLIVQRLRLGFGPSCAEADYNHKIELAKNGLILATDDIKTQPDGRCKLKPLSIAVIKDHGPGQEPEIYTIHADEAYILFDKPVKSLAEIGQRKIVGCDLSSDPSLLSSDPRRHRITCQHNRGTLAMDDDLVMETVGPVQYRELPQPEPPVDTAPPQVVTAAPIRITDKRGAPRSTVITALGMNIYLEAAKDKTAPGKNSGVSGVRQIELPEQVTMDLWIDPQNGFLSSGVDAAKKAAPPTAERTNVQITTPGPFKYLVGEESDTARFEMKPAAVPGERPAYVQVVRPIVKDGQTLYDRIDSEILELRFAHKAPDSKAPADKTDPGSSLQSIHASGQNVVITSQAENLQAQGNDLFHDAATKQSTLRGNPEVVAIKDGHEIHAPILVLTAAEGGRGQEATALGAGWFKGQPAAGAQGADAQRVLHARWQDRMHYVKEAGQELITLTGSALVDDVERKQTLAGEQIKLTLAPVPNAKPGAAQMKPRRLEVTGRVAARGPELNVQDTDQLVVLFQDAPAKPAPAAAPGTATTTAPPGVVPLTNPDAPAPDKPAPPPPAPKPPLALSARSIQALLTAYANGPTEIDNVHCEGKVIVHQEPTPPQQKPVHMTGDALDLKRKGEAYELKVSADVDREAVVTFPDISLAGPIVEIDQVDNEVKIKGHGAMRLVSKTDFQGNKLDKPTELLVTWKSEMYFNGEIALFQDDVHADQDNVKLLCHVMQVTMDQKVRFDEAGKAGGNGAKTAAVAKVFCGNSSQVGAAPVSLCDSLRENDKVVRYQRIDSRELMVDKPEGKMRGPGPGEVRILQKGAKDVQAPLAPAPAFNGNVPAKQEEELKLTYVRYVRELTVNNERRLAIFTGNVEVLHLPADDPGLHLDFNQLINKLPRGALYLKSERLEIYDEGNGPKKNHILRAIERVTVMSDAFYGEADVVTYNEEKQQVVFEGRRDRLAVLSQLQGKGQAPKRFTGERFIYDRVTGRVDVSGGRSISLPN